MNETKEQFIARWIEKDPSCETVEQFHEKYVILPCDCWIGGGPTHWARIRKSDIDFIQDHLLFHAPKGTPWPEGIPHPNDKYTQKRIVE